MKESTFMELKNEELEQIEGGNPWGIAAAIVGLCGTALVGGFNAGRQFIRDVKEKF